MPLKEALKKLTDLRYHEIKLFIGDKQDSDSNIIYIIRFFYGEGLMSMFYKCLWQIEYCRKQGWIPFVDLEHFKTQYTNKTSNNNPWECFFTQPNLYLNRDLHKKRKIIIGSMNPPKDTSLIAFGKYWANSFEKYAEKNKVLVDNIDFNREIKEYATGLGRDLGVQDCIGVLARGTDYISLKPKGHPKQPDSEELIEMIDSFVDKYDRRIFLVTEDATIKQKLVNRYGNRVITIDSDIVFNDYQKGTMLYKSALQMNPIQVAQTYLLKILLLAQCSYLVGGKTNGTLVANIINGGCYKETLLYDQGWY